MCEPKENASRWEKVWCALMDARALEFQNAIICVLLGAWLMAPTKLFESCPQVYQFMGWLQEFWWGVAFTVAGMAHFVALAINDKWWRKHLLLLKGFLWLNLAITVGFGDISAPAFPVYMIFAINAFRGFLCIRVPQPSEKGA
jgi:hypothetical protein